MFLSQTLDDEYWSECISILKEMLVIRFNLHQVCFSSNQVYSESKAANYTDVPVYSGYNLEDWYYTTGDSSGGS